MTPEELRAAMRSAQVPGAGQYIGDGRHHLELALGFIKRSAFEGKVKETWIFEFKVLESSNQTHEVGSTRTYAENPNNDGYLGRVKHCLISLAGLDPTSKLTSADEDTIGNIIVALRYDEERVRMGWPENFLKGRRVYCEGMAGKSRKGSDITNKKWAPAPAAGA